MNNSKGFTLVEVMTSLLILTVITTVLLTTLVTVYNERASIRQEEVALLHLEKAITSWVYEGELVNEQELEYKNTMYTFSFITTSDQDLKTCINWIGANKRQYERCANGKR